MSQYCNRNNNNNLILIGTGFFLLLNGIFNYLGRQFGFGRKRKKRAQVNMSACRRKNVNKTLLINQIKSSNHQLLEYITN